MTIPVPVGAAASLALGSALASTCPMGAADEFCAGFAAETVELAEIMLRELNGSVGHVDDSDGPLYELFETTMDLHLRAAGSPSSGGKRSRRSVRVTTRRQNSARGFGSRP